MTKMRILLDMDKIQREHKYSAQRISDFVDAVLLEKCHLRKDGEGFYSGNGDNDDLMRFGKANYILSSKPWFLDNVKLWMFYCNDDTTASDEYVVEDVLEFYAKRPSAVA
jgi:hypothetical protein